jgi:hypothetical protein
MTPFNESKHYPVLCPMYARVTFVTTLHLIEVLGLLNTLTIFPP